jgi:diaminopimelate decarboxylase
VMNKKFSAYKKLVLRLLSENSNDKKGNLAKIIKQTLLKRNAILKMVKNHETPFYLFDQQALDARIREFSEVFNRNIPNLQIFYAVKSNSHQYLIKTMVKHGLGLDVSSGRELGLALDNKAKKIIYSGPGKTEQELNLAIDNNQKVTVNMDSFGELKRLGNLLKRKNKKIRAGVRIYTKYHGSWNKFGIAIESLADFFRQAKRYKNIELCGIQCHMSWSKDDAPYQKMLLEIAKFLKKDFNAKNRQEIDFIDFGGGYENNMLDGYYPWLVPKNEIIKIAGDYFNKKIDFSDKYYLSESVPLEKYAKTIGSTIKENLKPIIDCDYYCEPGRIISAKSMLLVFKIVDVKSKDLVILDGGINMVGSDDYDYFYIPALNLTHPAKSEIKCRLYGPLCTPHDFWSHYCYAKKLKEGDVIVMPNMGAYSYSLAQNFIKPIPETHILK